MRDSRRDHFVDKMISFGHELAHDSRFFSKPNSELRDILKQATQSVLASLKPSKKDCFFRARLHTPRTERPKKRTKNLKYRILLTILPKLVG